MESFQRDFLDLVTKKYALIYGRARRREYWMFMLWETIIITALAIVGVIFSAVSPTLGMLVFIVLLLVCLGLVVPVVAVGVRRLHDIGQTGWIMALNLIGLGIVPFIMAFLDSQPGENKYGPNPKGL
ncbi:MAG: DUF805 domain-containing protein [Deltaproteobacteria bacterium]|nr:DUF805 domain-containing protein [Deltaproteobacteria bacterium]